MYLLHNNYSLIDDWTDYLSEDKYIQRVYITAKNYIYRQIKILNEVKSKELSKRLNEEWDNSFIEFCKSQTLFYLNNDKFLYYIDVSKINFNALTPKNIYCFEKGIKQIYSKISSFPRINGKPFKDDITNIINLINKFTNLQKEINLDLITNFNLNKIQEYLNKVKEDIERNKTVIARN